MPNSTENNRSTEDWEEQPLYKLFADNLWVDCHTFEVGNVRYTLDQIYALLREAFGEGLQFTYVFEESRKLLLCMGENNTFVWLQLISDEQIAKETVALEVISVCENPSATCSDHLLEHFNAAYESKLEFFREIKSELHPELEVTNVELMKVLMQTLNTVHDELDDLDSDNANDFVEYFGFGDVTEDWNETQIAQLASSIDEKRDDIVQALDKAIQEKLSMLYKNERASILTTALTPATCEEVLQEVRSGDCRLQLQHKSTLTESLGKLITRENHVVSDSMSQEFIGELFPKVIETLVSDNPNLLVDRASWQCDAVSLLAKSMEKNSKLKAIRNEFSSIITEFQTVRRGESPALPFGMSDCIDFLSNPSTEEFADFIRSLQAVPERGVGASIHAYATKILTSLPAEIQRLKEIRDFADPSKIGTGLFTSAEKSRYKELLSTFETSHVTLAEKVEFFTLDDLKDTRAKEFSTTIQALVADMIRKSLQDFGASHQVSAHDIETYTKDTSLIAALAQSLSKVYLGRLTDDVEELRTDVSEITTSLFPDFFVG